MKRILRFFTFTSLAVGALFMVGCAHHYEHPQTKNYYHCVYKNKKTHKSFMANASNMKTARHEARQACHAAGHSSACRVSYCRYVH